MKTSIKKSFYIRLILINEHHFTTDGGLK